MRFQAALRGSLAVAHQSLRAERGDVDETGGITWSTGEPATRMPAISARRADRHHSNEVFFQSARGARSVHHSAGQATGGSRLDLIDGKLPITTSRFVSGPDALRLTWTSCPDGAWSAELRSDRWRFRTPAWAGTMLFFWAWSEDGIPADALPRLSLADLDGNPTRSEPWSSFAEDVPARRWTRVAVPLDRFVSSSIRPFDPQRLGTVVFSQGQMADGRCHELVLDELRIRADPGATRVPAAPQALTATGYERHVLLEWSPVEDPGLVQYVVHRSLNGAEWGPVGVQRAGVHLFCDVLGEPGLDAAYRVSARTAALVESEPSDVARARTRMMDDDDLLTMVQQASFRYYWDGAEPCSGMARENQPGADDLVAVGASGFGVMAIIVGVERGFVERDAAVERMDRITRFLEGADRFKGAWSHFLSGSTGRTVPAFGVHDDGADLVETSFLVQGLLAARQYYDRDTDSEQQLRERITRLWEAVDWDWFRATPERDALYWHWSPNFGFAMANRLEGWSEVHITYLLAAASPTHPIPPETYETGWARSGGGDFGQSRSWFGITTTQSYVPPSEQSPGTPGPLFFTHYSYLGFDPRRARDRFSDYAESNRAIAGVHRAYAVDDPFGFKGYGADSWGLSALDGPDDEYHEYKPFLTDDGTLAPTAAVASYAWAPDAAMSAIRHWYRDLGDRVWGVYGFVDSFNEQQDWYSAVHLGLNQAPQAVMIENGRTGLVWRCFMANPEIATMQERLGFTRDPA